MDPNGWSIPDNYRQIFNIASWVLGGLGGLWLVTSVLGYMHRRAYNLTHAESGGSQNIKPDFLKVDQAARKAATERGEAYEKKLQERERPAPAPAPPAEGVGQFARWSATITAIITLVAAIVGSLGKAESLQKGAERIGSFEKLGIIFREYPFGAGIAVICIAANIIAFTASNKKSKK